ncbi:Mu-like prophage major head subunit gpT family protein [bacterium]|nr:Mu-like prophage major head subunit gpT family protein [bacterium]
MPRTDAITAKAGHITLTGAAELQADGAGQKIPRFSMVAYNGGPLVVAGYIDPVVIDLSGLEIGARSKPILRDHDPRQVVGHSDEIAVIGNRLIVRGVISAGNAVANEIVSASRNGFPWQASVGVKPTRTAPLKDGQTITVNGQQTTGPANVVLGGILKEVSFVAMGADESSSVAIAAKMKGLNVDEQNPGIDAPEESTAVVDPIQESARIVGVVRACRGEHPKIQAEAIEAGWSVDQTRLAVMRASRPALPAITERRSEGVNNQVLAAAILLHAGRGDLATRAYGERATQQAHDLRARSLGDLFEAPFKMVGQTPPADINQTIRASNNGLSGLSMPVALGDAANKILGDRYRLESENWQEIAKVASANDFKTQNLLRPSTFPKTIKLPPGGEIKSGSLAESNIVGRLDTSALLLRLSRRDVINDDLGVFDQLAEAMGASAAAGVSDDVFGAILSAGSHFSSGNGNLVTGSTSALDIDSLAVAIQRMRKQTDANSHTLNIRPRVLLVPPELEFSAMALIRSATVEANPATGKLTPAMNPAMGVVEKVVVEPRLSSTAFAGNSTTAWYLVAAQTAAPLYVWFLRSRRTPTVEFFGLDNDPSVLALQWRVYFDYGVSIGDPKAMVKANGA